MWDKRTEEEIEQAEPSFLDIHLDWKGRRIVIGFVKNFMKDRRKMRIRPEGKNRLVIEGWNEN